MGYFSKEKESSEDYNVACILVLPPYQRNLVNTIFKLKIFLTYYVMSKYVKEYAKTAQSLIPVTEVF